MRLHESGEMYIEAIYFLIKQGKEPRSIDVVEYMGYSKPSVSRAMGILRKADMINISSGGIISFTEEGKKVADKIYERHSILTEMLIMFGIDSETASEDACKIEHVISDESFEAIKLHMKKHTNQLQQTK